MGVLTVLALEPLVPVPFVPLPVPFVQLRALFVPVAAPYVPVPVREPFELLPEPFVPVALLVLVLVPEPEIFVLPAA